MRNSTRGRMKGKEDQMDAENKSDSEKVVSKHRVGGFTDVMTHLTYPLARSKDCSCGHCRPLQSQLMTRVVLGTFTLRIPLSLNVAPSPKIQGEK